MESEAEAEIEVVVEPDYEEYRRVLFEKMREPIQINRVFLGLELTALMIWLPSTLLSWTFNDETHRAILIVLCTVFAIHIFAYRSLTNGLRAQARAWVTTGVITYIVRSSGLMSSSEVAKSEYSWNGFETISESKYDFQFALASRNFISIPKRFVSDEAQLRRLITENATGTVELTQ